MKGSVLLIPNLLADTESQEVLPENVRLSIMPIRYFVVENLRTARRFLRKIGYTANFDTEVKLFELNKHTDFMEVSDFLKPVLEGNDMGIISESGMPCVADPGHWVVEEAHRLNIKVKPFVGPNSIILSLAASGFNGQNFTFHGYLPKDSKDRQHKFREMENAIMLHDQTQIFIEAPFRNNQLFDALVRNLNANTKLCIACEITSGKEFIQTKSIQQWRKSKPNIQKKNTIFLLYK